MRTSAVSLWGVIVLAGLGCSSSAPPDAATAKPEVSGQSAKPAVTTVNKPIVEKNMAGKADGTFSLSVPFEKVTLTQGGEKSVLIGINRGDNFAEDVAVKVSGLPQGVTLETSDAVIHSGSKEIALALKASPDAALGEFDVKVEGRTASSGADFVKDFKIAVTQK